MRNHLRNRSEYSAGQTARGNLPAGGLRAGTNFLLICRATNVTRRLARHGAMFPHLQQLCL